MLPRVIYEGDVTEGAKWLRWAQNQMVALPSPDERPISRVMAPVDGVTVYLLSGPGGQSIRIVAESGADTPFLLSAGSYIGYQAAEYALSASVDYRDPRFMSVANVAVGDATPYHLVRVKKSGAKVGIDFERFPTKADALEVLNSPPTSTEIAPGAVDGYLLRAIEARAVEVVSALLNKGTTITNEWKEHKLAVSRLDGRFQFKQFNAPSESHAMYVRYLAVIQKLIEAGFEEVPLTKYLLEQQSLSSASLESLITSLGMTPAETSDPIFGAFYQNVEISTGGNLISGVQVVRIRHEASVPGVLTPNREVMDCFTVNYDADAQSLAKTSTFRLKDTVAASITYPEGSSSGFVFFDQTVQERIYYLTHDGVKTNSYANLRLLGVENGTFTFTQTSTVVDGDASGQADIVGRWVTGAQTFDIYANGSVKLAGAEFVSLTLSPAAPAISVIGWGGETIGEQIECDYFDFQTTGVTNFVRKSWQMFDPPIFTWRSTTTPTVVGVTRANAVFDRVSGFASMPSITLPYLTAETDGICLYNITAGLSTFNSAVQAYLAAKWNSIGDAAERDALLATARGMVSVVRNNFLDDEALVVLASTSSAGQVVIL